jgi:hypothetical protein
LRERLDNIRRVSAHEKGEATGEALTAWREYMGSKLELRPGSLTLGEMQAELYLRGVGEDIILEIGELFQSYEQHSYREKSGGPSGPDPSILSRITRVAAELERRFARND